ncbi:MAG: hypothetical protein BEN19_05860 [Epulopiscium sp. Nuni2H_MBin003]|nr:MAG: hypothetical protein BEN19_05860 [Epulopiscium sp. Nuni2H_MBin003]
MDIIKNAIPKLGSVYEIGNNVTFGIYLSKLDEIKLSIYTDATSEPILTQVLKRNENSLGDFFYTKISQISQGMLYTWSVSSDGKEYFLIDPYALDVIQEQGKYFNKIVDLTGNDTRSINIPWEETIIYEMHVGHFTHDKSAGVNSPATFEGVTEKLDYLKELGITTIELMPIYLWNRNTLANKHPETNQVLTDEWGYNPISFFALDPVYMSKNQDVREEFKKFVRSVHDRGLEVILDVVYNHTGEGGDKNTIFNFKILNKFAYYRHKNQYFANCSGTGNTLNTSHPIVQELVIASLRYWVMEMGVDGFRFDLASILAQGNEGTWIEYSLINEISQDPILSNVKLISESWDAKGQYDVGKMPSPFHEWSDIFRDCVRSFGRGDKGQINHLATCIAGNDLKSHNYNSKCLPIHYVTAHDGFTLWDLVSYNEKHNLLNGEDNRDGSSNNISDNSGIEGETDDEYVNSLRVKRVKTFLGLLLFSKGVPMILMGDEGARTQQGNNNAFCQNNELVWLNWDRMEKFKDIALFVKRAIKLRNKLNWFKDPTDKNIVWHGTKLYSPDWSYFSRSLAWTLQEEDHQIYFVVNNYSEPLVFNLPKAKYGWKLFLDTNQPSDLKSEIIDSYLVDEFSLCVLIDTQSLEE